MEYQKPKKKRRWLKVTVIIVGILIIIRLILPYVVLNYMNKSLKELKEFSGHINDIDLAIIRGAYQIDGIRIDKKDTITGKVDSIPFFTAENIDLSVEWRALFKGRIVGEIEVNDPVLNFVKGKHKKEEAKNDTSDFRTMLRKMMPLTINHFEINNGQMRYVDRFSKPHVDVRLTNVYVKADNLTNVNDSNQVLPASLKANGNAYDGSLEVNVKFNAFEKQPTFDLNAKVTDVNMVRLNDFFRAYANFDVNKGTFGLYTEFAAKEGMFDGYVKPLIKDLDVVDFDKEKGNVAQLLWESVVGSVAEIFQNQPKDQLATKLPIRGDFRNPESSLWTAISYVLRNAFVFALRPSIDNTVNIGNVMQPEEEKKTFLQKIFGKKDKNGEKKEGNEDNDQKEKGDNKGTRDAKGSGKSSKGEW